MNDVTEETRIKSVVQSIVAGWIAVMFDKIINKINDSVISGLTCQLENALVVDAIKFKFQN